MAFISVVMGGSLLDFMLLLTAVPWPYLHIWSPTKNYIFPQRHPSYIFEPPYWYFVSVFVPPLVRTHHYPAFTQPRWCYGNNNRVNTVEEAWRKETVDYFSSAFNHDTLDTFTTQ